ncbi:30S ribosomal protein S6 [bioreactor metagenome]|uniref:30S ribosomal protein S6 n=1 Tax=bioreactor metagenome TaxID=1076179 RepID=A0A645DN35_9ZZZZ|nr:30S ribosomal protein S6 [Erysipelotrichaceae bacterium]
MRKYEVMYIIKADLEDEARQEVIKSLHAIITDNGGTIDNVDEWGVRELAYEIDDMNKGYYVVTKLTAGTDALKEFDRLIHINGNVIRYMIVSMEE